MNNCAAVSPLGGGGGNMESESVVVKDAIKINQKKTTKKVGEISKRGNEQLDLRWGVWKMQQLRLYQDFRIVK